MEFSLKEDLGEQYTDNFSKSHSALFRLFWHLSISKVYTIRKTSDINNNWILIEVVVQREDETDKDRKSILSDQ